MTCRSVVFREKSANRSLKMRNMKGTKRRKRKMRGEEEGGHDVQR